MEMTTFLAGVTTFFTQSLDWMGTILEKVVENPALTVLVLAMPIAGFGVGIFNRIVRG